jgi:hypothetical protein
MAIKLIKFILSGDTFLWSKLSQNTLIYALFYKLIKYIIINKEIFLSNWHTLLNKEVTNRETV